MTDYSFCEDEDEERFWRSWDAGREPMERRPFDAEEFARFRADPKRQALVRRILAALDEPQ